MQASPGQTESQVGPSSQLAATCDSVWPWLNAKITVIYFSCKGRFTRYDFVAYGILTTGLRHELFLVNQTYNSLNSPKSCRRPVVRLSYATKSYRVNRP